MLRKAIATQQKAIAFLVRQSIMLPARNRLFSTRSIPNNDYDFGNENIDEHLEENIVNENELIDTIDGYEEDEPQPSLKNLSLDASTPESFVRLVQSSDYNLFKDSYSLILRNLINIVSGSYKNSIRVIFDDEKVREVLLRMKDDIIQGASDADLVDLLVFMGRLARRRINYEHALEINDEVQKKLIELLIVKINSNAYDLGY